MTTWLVTGASSGLGRALAEHLLAGGHQVVATARDLAAIDDLRRAYGTNALTVALDVTDPAAVSAAVSAAEQTFGGVDVLVNNAGYAYVAAVEEGEEGEVERLFATNVRGPVDVMKAVLPGMRARGTGTVVNISSVGALTTLPGGGYYAATKAALEALSGSLRREVEPLGLRVVVVEPGSFRTDFRGRSTARSARRITAYDHVLGRVDGGGLGPQVGDPAKAAVAIVEAVTHADPPRLLVLGSGALRDRAAVVEADAREIARFHDLAVGTDLV